MLVKFFFVAALLSLGPEPGGGNTTPDPGSGGVGGGISGPQDFAIPEDPVKEGFSPAQEEVNAAQSAKACLKIKDPVDTRKCWPRPPWLWPDRYISYLRPIRYCPWWPWVKALAITKKMAARSEEARQALSTIPTSFQADQTEEEVDKEAKDLEIAEQLKHDWREYYWKLSCPYRLYYLGKFYHRHLRWCWIVSAHWWQKTQYAVCRSKHCNIRCKYINPRIKNSVCFGANYRYYRRLLYCPWARRSCRNRPWRCFYWRTIKLPQCCQCWHCWYMGVTRVLHEATTSEETKAAMFETEEEGEGGEGGETAAQEITEASFIPPNEEEPPVEPPEPKAG